MTPARPGRRTAAQPVLWLGCPAGSWLVFAVLALWSSGLCPTKLEPPVSWSAGWEAAGRERWAGSDRFGRPAARTGKRNPSYCAVDPERSRR